MALYLGNEKVKISLGSVACLLNLVYVKPTTNGILLLSSDGFTLKDSNGVYLTVKESD